MMSTPPSSSAECLRDALNAVTPNPTELLAFLPSASSPSESSIDVDESNTPPTSTNETISNGNKLTTEHHTKMVPIAPSFETTAAAKQSTVRPSQPPQLAQFVTTTTTAATTNSSQHSISDADLLRSVQHDVALKWPKTMQQTKKKNSPAPQGIVPPPRRQVKQSTNKRLGAHDVVLPNPLPRPVGDEVEDDDVMRQYREQGMTADLIARKKLKMGAPKHLWIAEEDIVLASGVAQLGEKCWSEIATLLPGRVGKQCRDRWRNHLCPMVKKGSWTDHEDRLLFYHHQKLGNMWAEIAKQIPGRTDLSVKNRFYSYLRKIGRQMARAAKERHAFNQQAVFRYLRSPKNEPGLAEVSPECWAVDHSNGGFSAALFAAKQADADKAAGVAPSVSSADGLTSTTVGVGSSLDAAKVTESGVTSTGMVPGIALPMEEVTPELAYAYDKVLGGIAKQPPEPLPTFTGPFNANIMDRGGSHTPLGKAAAKAALDAGQLAAKVKEKKRKASNASFAAAARKKKAAAAAAAAAVASAASASTGEDVNGIAALAATGVTVPAKRGGKRAGAGGVKKRTTTYLYNRKTNSNKTIGKKTATKKKSKKPKGLTVETGGIAGPGGGAGGQGALGMLTSLLAAGTEDAALVTAIAGLTEMATPNSRAAQRKRTASAAALAVAAASAASSGAVDNNKNKRKKRSKRTVTEVAAAALAMKQAKRAKASGGAGGNFSSSSAATNAAANNNGGGGGIKKAVDSAADLLLGLAQPSLSPHSSPSPAISSHTAATPKNQDSTAPSSTHNGSIGDGGNTDDATGAKRKLADVHVVVPPNDKFDNDNGANNNNPRVSIGAHVLDVNTMFSPVGNIAGNGSIGGGGNGSTVIKATPKNVGGSNNAVAAGEISKRVFASPIASGSAGSGVGGGKHKTDMLVVARPAQ